MQGSPIIVTAIAKLSKHLSALGIRPLVERAILEVNQQILVARHDRAHEATL
jgi:hypothetical protein